VIKVLSSKNYPAGNMNRWWYNLSSPNNWVEKDTKINLILNDEYNKTNIGTIILQLDRNSWYDRIMNASRHVYRGREIIKVHVIEEYGSQQYYIYFGRKENGFYPVNI
jgi:putative heme iron utilization protein